MAASVRPKDRSRKSQDSRVSGPRRRRNSSVLVFVAALAMAAAGLAFLLQARSRAPVREAVVGGLLARLETARWVEDQMPHDGQGFARPAVMMPGMPERGFQRLSVELALRNVGDPGTVYRGEEFSLVSARGQTYTVQGALIGTARLDRGQALNTTLFYDVNIDEEGAGLKLVWRRDKETVYMPVPPLPEHYHAQPRGDVTWPPSVTVLLPIGSPERGEILYKSTFACAACHGDPGVPDSNNVGPHLGRIGLEATHRVPEISAPQYLYESILRPNDFIAPQCRGGVPCATPSSMPDYSTLLALQEMADLIAYLVTQTG